MKIENRSKMHKQPALFESNEFPLVSVIVPAYNAQQYIGATLQSLIRQSYPHLEIIVTDDGSIDRTAEIVKNAMLKDRRIRLLQQHNSGVAAARNLAIRQSRGSFIAPVDADDICLPEKIAKLLDGLQKAGKSSGLACSWSATIDQYGCMIGQGQRFEFEGDVFEYLLFQNFVGNGSSCLIRKNCFDVVGLYNTTFFSQKAQGCEDYDIYLRIAEKFEFKLVREVLTGYRKTMHSMSNNYKTMERSRKLVFRDQKIRTPWIHDVVFNWAFAYFSLWLSSMAVNKGCYYDSLAYLIKAAHYDPLLIKNTGYLKLLFNPLKGGLKNILPSSFTPDNRKVDLQNAQNSIMIKENISIKNIEKTCGINPKRSSLTLLKENRRMIAYHLIRRERIKNGHLVR
jgi:glycosyltransferase involved in cell wall biosynthesis